MPQNLIQANFNQAAKSYITHALLQKKPAQKIIAQLPTYALKDYILDLGSGPGTLCHQPDSAFQPILYDISLQMLKSGRCEKYIPAVNGEAAYLPFASDSINTIISNLMLQWPEDKSAVFSEIQRILKPNGILIFTTLISPSLWQLRHGWQKLDTRQHTLNFLSSEAYAKLCLKSGLSLLHCECWAEQLCFPDIQALFQHFKLTGTSMPKSDCSTGLGGKNLLAQLNKVYPAIDKNGFLQLSYHFQMIIARSEKCHTQFVS